MATLAESVLGGAQEAANQQGHTFGDAMQAYHIAATAEHARQELEMEKEKQEMAKGQWTMQQLDGIGRMSGPAQKVALDAFKKQMQQINPGMNPDNIDIMAKDPEVLRAMAVSAGQTLSRGDLSPESAQNLLGLLNGDTQKFVQAAQSIGEQHAQIQAQQNRNAGMTDVRQQMVDLQTHNKATEAITKNPMINQLVTSKQNLENAISNFQQGGATPQEFAELQQAVRANLGIKGQSGVGERGETYLNSIGLSKDKLNQFLTGDPQSILNSDSAFSKQIIGLANLELQNKSRQGIQQINKLAGQYSSFYKRPTMAEHAQDFMNTVDATKSQFAPLSGSGTIKNADGSVTHQGVTYVQQSGQWVPQGQQAAGADQ